MSTVFTRGACPGLSAPMQTGDGLLVRLTPRGNIPVEAFVDLCALARQHGNGRIEVTARGNLQVRGLTPQSAPAFATAVTDLAVASTCLVPLITDPLPDDPDVLINVTRVADDLTQAIARLETMLAPKISIALDGGSRLHLDALSADIRLRAVPSTQGPRLQVALGGDAHGATMLGTVAPTGAADVATRLLDVIARRGPTARATDVLRNEGTAPFRSAVADEIEPALAFPTRPAAEPIGLHPLCERLALGIALAFGQAEADVLGELASVARRHGATALRPTPGRALLLLGLDESDAAAVTRTADRLGFITRADDPRRRIAACAGKPACASAHLATRALAAAIAPKLPHADGIALHISGCPKGCAHPASTALTIVGDAFGAGIVRDGPASATPSRHVDADDLIAEITALTQMSEADHG